MELGTVIKQLRKEYNMTQNDLAEKLYVSRQAVSKWETNRGRPEMDTLNDMARLFNVSIDTFFQSNYDNSYMKKHRMKLQVISIVLEVTIVLSFIVPLFYIHEQNITTYYNLFTFPYKYLWQTMLFYSLFIGSIVFLVTKVYLVSKSNGNLFIKSNVLSNFFICLCIIWFLVVHQITLCLYYIINLLFRYLVQSRFFRKKRKVA